MSAPRFTISLSLPGPRRVRAASNLKRLRLCCRLDGAGLCFFDLQPASANALLVALTGYGQESDKERSLAAGFNLHLVKACRPAKTAGRRQRRPCLSAGRWCFVFLVHRCVSSIACETRPTKMPASSLLALLDDIATILDDVAVLTKVAAKKTAGVLGDDLALNAQQVSGVRAERELPVVWRVARGSVRNKLILVPAALAISAVAPWAITPLLMLGGAFLCYEGVEKLAHKLLHSKAERANHHKALITAVAASEADLLALEAQKIKGAVTTDFILSAEIVIIALGTVATSPLGTRVAVLVSIAVIMTVGVYGLVAGIVKLDDLGAHLVTTSANSDAAKFRRGVGGVILKAAPWLMKSLSFAGTVAMFLVGGGILTHGISIVDLAIAVLASKASQVNGLGGFLAYVVPSVMDGAFGILVGVVLVTVATAGRWLWRRVRL